MEKDSMLSLEGVGMAKGQSAGIQILPIKKIKLAKNSRMSVSAEELDGLMQSIKSVGLLQPIGVTKNGSGYEICYGNRRFLACSKLGLSKIACVVHESKKAFDSDIKNLTENIQRRNISLAEAGRYVELLNKDGLTLREIAVRLGVSAGYVESCRKAYSEVPKEFRDDLEIKVSNEKLQPGKISMKAAQAILSAAKTFRLEKDDVKLLFRAAKADDRFTIENVPKYAAALKAGKKNFTKEVSPIKHVRVQFTVTEDHWNELEKKYVHEGPLKPFKSFALQF